MPRGGCAPDGFGLPEPSINTKTAWGDFFSLLVSYRPLAFERIWI